MANVMNHWLVSHNSTIVNFSEKKCRDILKAFNYDPISIEVSDNQIKIINKIKLIPKKIIRILVNAFFDKQSEVKLYAEDDLHDYYKYYKVWRR